jgi:hypothetical protein
MKGLFPRREEGVIGNGFSCNENLWVTSIRIFDLVITWYIRVLALKKTLIAVRGR